MVSIGPRGDGVEAARLPVARHHDGQAATPMPQARRATRPVLAACPSAKELSTRTPSGTPGQWPRRAWSDSLLAYGVPLRLEHVLVS